MKPRINWKPYIIAGIISLLLGAFIFILFFIILKMPALDGTGFAAILLIATAGLIWIAREGFFDIFTYGFRQLGSTMFGKKANEFNDFASYKEMKFSRREKRSKYFISVAIVGALFLIATIILSLIYKL